MDKGGATLTNPAQSDPLCRVSGRNPTLSVVVLTFNSAGTIESCLDSLVEQEFADFETVIVDDNSTDDTVDLVKQYESRLHLGMVKNGARNIPRGRNIGLRQSSGDIVAFVDSDDMATRTWTRIIIETFWTKPEVALITGPFISAYRTKTAQAIGLNDAMVQRLAGRIVQFCAANCAINRTLLPGDIFDEDSLAAEDLELVSRIQRQYLVKSGSGIVCRPTSEDIARAIKSLLENSEKQVAEFDGASVDWARNANALKQTYGL